MMIAAAVHFGHRSLYQNYVVAHLKFDDVADASTTINDEIGKAWTANGNAQIDTAQAKFGSGSLLLDGTGDYADTPDSADWDNGSGAFSYLIQVRPNLLNSVARYICAQANSAGTAQAVVMHINASNKFYGYCYDGAVTFGDCIASGLTLSTGTWYALDYVRDGNNFYVRVDGVQQATATSSKTVPNVAAKFALGRLGENVAGGQFNGWLDEFVALKGVAVFRDAPTIPFPKF